MAKGSPHGQRQSSHGTVGTGVHVQTWPPARLVAPAILESRAGRHRKENGPPAPAPDTWSRATPPAAFPPHPPLMSGGWYHGMSIGEVLGPGRYPVENPPDKSVVVAVALSTVLGPAGLCYTSIVAGLIASGATLIALILFGFVSLLVVWPLAIGAAAIGARMRHRRYQRQ